MTPEELAEAHHAELETSGLSVDSRAIVALATKMLVDFAVVLVDSTKETSGAEAEQVSRMFLRQAAEMLDLGGDEAAAGTCQGDCGVAAHRDLVAIGPDGTRIYRGTP